MGRAAYSDESFGFGASKRHKLAVPVLNEKCNVHILEVQQPRQPVLQMRWEFPHRPRLTFRTALAFMAILVARDHFGDRVVGIRVLRFDENSPFLPFTGHDLLLLK